MEFPDGHGRWNAFRLSSIVGVVDSSSDYEDDEELVGEDARTTNIATVLLLDAYGFDSMLHGWVGAPKDAVMAFLLRAANMDGPLLRFE